MNFAISVSTLNWTDIGLGNREEHTISSSPQRPCNHPLMYRPVSKILSGDPLHALVGSGISLIAAHTNLDVAVGGIADLMLARLGFPKSETVILPINPDGSGYGRIIELGAPVSAGDLAGRCKAAFGCTVVSVGFQTHTHFIKPYQRSVI